MSFFQPTSTLLAIKLIVFFASNPETKLTDDEVARKYTFKRDRITNSLKAAITRGYVQVEFIPGGRISGHPQLVFSAGNELLNELGYGA